MLNKDEFMGSLSHEINCIKHLASKVTPGMQDYRPTEGQRSTLELMQFMSNMASASLTAILEGGWDKWKGYEDARKAVTLENFAQKMDEQLAEVKEIFAKFSDEEFEKDLDLFKTGYAMKKRIFIVETIYKWFVGYKMQLFLYAKANGAQIGTMDLWQGKDTPAKMQ